MFLLPLKQKWKTQGQEDKNQQPNISLLYRAFWSSQHCLRVCPGALCILRQNPCSLLSSHFLVPGVKDENDGILPWQVSPREKPYRVGLSQCGQDFRQLRNHLLHQQTHIGEKPLPYNGRGIAFSVRTADLNLPRLLSREKPYQYTERSRVFNSWSTLRRHRKDHVGKKPHTCEECGKDFSCNSNLSIHPRVHMGEKPDMCQVCRKDLSCSSNLSNHQRVHMGEKPFRCRDCGKDSICVAAPQIHQNVRPGRKPHACEVCDWGLTSRSALAWHWQDHAGDKAYVCDTCSQGFSQRVNPAHPYWGETIPVWGLWEAVWPEQGPGPPPEGPHQKAAL